MIYHYGPDAYPNLYVICRSIRHPQRQSPRRAGAAAGESLAGRGAYPDLALGRFLRSAARQHLVLPKADQTRPAGARRDVPRKRGIDHDWAYLPDAGETFARLAEREQALEPLSRFHFAEHWDPDGTAMISAVGRAVGNPALKVKSPPC